ncbi:MAG: ABC transporter ATP-binding protein [Deltaproteobacteria bacterium]|nr:ABC transporter ATP-binding protein [Deltaproteobacteria bacterium]
MQFENVCVKRRGHTVLELPDLSLPAKEITVVTGENGAGKTTFLLVAAGLLDLQQGQVKMFDELFHRGRAPAPKNLRRRIAFVFQDPYLFRSSVAANISYGLKIRKVPKAERRKRAEAVMQRLGIFGLAQRPANDLSGGERKLVALGRALVMNPELLFLDEVTASLDDEARDKVLTLIKSLVDQHGTSVLMATHLDSIASRLSAKNIVVKAGRIGN